MFSSIGNPFFWYSPETDEFSDDDFAELIIDVRPEASAGELESQHLRSPSKKQLLEHKEILKVFVRLFFTRMVPRVVWNVVSKEELAKVKKIELGDGRTFLVAPGVFFVIQQILFRKQEQAIKRCGRRRSSPFTYGYNTRGGGFHRILQEHRSVDGRTSGFDEKIKDSAEFPWHYECVKGIRKSVHEPQYHDLVDLVYFEIQHSQLLMGDGVLLMKHLGNPSGQGMTTTDNCITTLYNIVDTFVSFMSAKYPEYTTDDIYFLWKKHVTLDILGDDGLLTITNPLLRDGWTFTFIRQQAAVHGIRLIFDTEEGTDPESCCYLSQTFVRDPTTSYFVPVPNYAKVSVSMAYMGKNWTIAEKCQKLVNLSNEMAHLHYFPDHRHMWIALKTLYAELSEESTQKLPLLKTPAEVLTRMTGIQSDGGGLTSPLRMTKKSKNVVERELAALKKAQQRRDASDRNASRQRGGNGYLASLADPWHYTARVPDEDTSISATVQQVATFELAAAHTINGSHSIACVVSPGLYSDLAFLGANALANLDAAEWGVGGAILLNDISSVQAQNEFAATCSGLRPVSAGIRVRYTGPQLTAQGAFVVAPCNPGDCPVMPSGTFNDLFNGTVEKASQIAGAQVFTSPEMAEGVAAESNWAPVGTSSFVYVNPADVNLNGAKGFYQAPNVFATQWAHGLDAAAWPYWYIIGRDLDPAAVIVIERVVNWEVHPMLAQFNIGQALSVSDPVALAHATNVQSQINLAATDKDMGMIRKAAIGSAKELGRTRGTPKERETVSGETFGSKLKGLASRAGSALLDNLPQIGGALLAMI